MGMVGRVMVKEDGGKGDGNYEDEEQHKLQQQKNGFPYVGNWRYELKIILLLLLLLLLLPVLLLKITLLLDAERCLFKTRTQHHRMVGNYRVDG